MFVTVMCRPRLLERPRGVCLWHLQTFVTPTVLLMWWCTLLGGMLRPLSVKVMLLLIMAVMTRPLGSRNITFIPRWTLQTPLLLSALTFLISMALSLGRRTVPKRPVRADPL